MVIFIVIFLASIAALFYILIKNFKKKTKIVSSVLCVVLAVSSIIAGLNYISKAKLTDYNWNEWVKNKETISDTVESLRNTEEYKSANYDEKVKLMEQCLKKLQEKGLIKNLHYNDYIFHFDYSLSGSGGIVVKDTHNDNCWGSFHNARTKSIKFNQSIFNKSLLNYANLPSSTNLKNQNWAFIFNTSAIKDNESYNQFSWLASECKDLNINVRMQKNSTVSMYRNLSNKDLIYITGHAFYDEKKSIPIIWTVEQLTEEKLKNTDYMSDIISDINNNSIGIYKDESEQDFFVILPEFFENNYSNNELDGSIVLFGNCEIFGNNDKECLALYNSLKKSGVSTVIGFCNSVNQTYSLFFHEKIINCLLRGKTIGDAFEEAKDTIGKNENEYFKEYYTDLSLEEKPAFPILKGLTNKKLIYNDLDNLGEYGFTIKDIDSKKPIKNVRVFIYNSENDRECVHSYKSNEKGDVSVELPDGNYTCELVHPSYQKTSYNITIKNDMLTTLFDPVYMTKKNYSWLVEPTIEADDIIVFDESMIPDRKTNARSEKIAQRKDYAIIQKGNKYGFISYSGRNISKINYQYIHTCLGCGAVDLYNGEYSNVFYINDKFELQSNAYGCQHGCGGRPSVLEQNSNSSKFALINMNTGKKVTNYIFDYIYANYYGVSEIAACKKDGKWGYYSYDGKEIIPCQFDDVENKLCYEKFSDGEIHNDVYEAYLPTYGYIAVNKDGGYGYYNTDGKEVVPCGEFEQARPVYDGKAWVKKDGKWGVILIENEKAEISDNETTENTNAPTNQNLSAKLSIPDDVKQFNGHSYYVFDDLYESWEEAEAYCESLGGHLAVINNEEENKAVFDIMKELGYDSAYFGYTDSENEGSWKWVNGESSQYENWSDGEPNNERGIENYAMFYYQSPDYEWNDGDFDSTVNGGKAFICEWDQDLSENTEAKNGETSTTTSDERDIVLVLDTSSSMSGTPLDETKKASNKFIETILKNDASIGIVTYNYEANIDSDFSVDDVRLKNSVSEISSGGDTNIESGLETAYDMLKDSKAKKKIIVLMSDGKPNEGKEGDDLITYAEDIKKNNIYIYTLGFFEDLDDDKSSAQILMEEIASDGCHYEVDNADDLVFFFGDIADQLNGQKYIYVRLACPVDVYVSHNGEVLNSAEDDISVRANFGTLTFEDIEDSEGHEENENNIKDQIKILRLKEGEDYNVQIKGYGRGKMDYTIGFMDENGEYSDLRKFKDIRVTKRTIIDTVAQNSESTVLNIDKDGDGKYDLKYKATKNGNGEIVEYTYIYYIIISGVFVLLFATTYICIKRYKRKKL